MSFIEIHQKERYVEAELKGCKRYAMQMVAEGKYEQIY